MTRDDFRTRQVLADLDRAAGVHPPADASRAAFDAEVAPDRLWAAAATLVRQALADQVRDPFLEDLWTVRQGTLRAAPAPIRAALANGFDRLCDLAQLPGSCRPGPEDRLTATVARLEPALIALARQMTEAEIDHVSRADYGCDAARHRNALLTLLADPRVAYPPDEYWFPAEVIELVSHVPGQPGHMPCLAIVLLDALRTGDAQGNAEYRLGQQAETLAMLARPECDAVFAAFRHLYESIPLWTPLVPAPFTLPWVSLADA
jgi:hypothetical protein